MSFTKNSICIIGSGVYGSYTLNGVIKKYPNEKVALFEVGNKKIQDEVGIEYNTKLTNLPYTGLSKGRFFGLGGTSNKWGGQLFFFKIRF